MLNDNQYFKEKQFKNQIVIHHTAGGSNADNVIHGWNFNVERIGTAYLIDGLGVVKKAFEPEFWAYHLGLKSGNNLSLNKGSIGIEICNWGQLIKKGDKYYNYVNKEVPENEVVFLKKFRGFEYYHKYNDLQNLLSIKNIIVICGIFRQML
jgi:N-acetyl-anhydromuramyl-L-alanine amidase AmpD